MNNQLQNFTRTQLKEGIPTPKLDKTEPVNGVEKCKMN